MGPEQRPFAWPPFCFAPPAPAAYHPHAFVGATVGVLTEADAVTGVRLVWTYDDFFSLMLTEDLGIDTADDLVPTEKEVATLEANVADWPPDYTDDLVIRSGDAELPSPPASIRTSPSRTGASLRRTTAHSPRLPAPRGAVMAEVLDLYYYFVYTVKSVTVTGEPACQATLIPADLEAALTQLDATWAGLDWASAPPDEQLPAIGEAFTDRVEIRCGG